MPCIAALPSRCILLRAHCRFSQGRPPGSPVGIATRVVANRGRTHGTHMIRHGLLPYHLRASTHRRGPRLLVVRLSAVSGLCGSSRSRHSLSLTHTPLCNEYIVHCHKDGTDAYNTLPPLACHAYDSTNERVRSLVVRRRTLRSPRSGPVWGRERHSFFACFGLALGRPTYLPTFGNLTTV